MIRLGMPALIELEGLEQNVALCQGLGLSVLELSMNLPQYCPENLMASALRRLTEETGIMFTLHLPEEVDLATFHAAVREGHLARAIEAVRWAADAGIGLVNMHLHGGVYYTLPDERVYVYERCAGLFRGNLLRSFEALHAEAGRAGVLLCVENTGLFNLGYVTGPLQELLDAGMIGLTWDTGHDGAAGHTDRPFMLRNLAYLRHMHLNDYSGAACHKPLFTGSLDAAEMLKIADAHDLAAIVEVKTSAALTESVERLGNFRPGIAKIQLM